MILNVDKSLSFPLAQNVFILGALPSEDESHIIMLLDNVVVLLNAMPGLTLEYTS